jgi:hypothetical protein
MGILEEILAEIRKLNAKLDHIGGATVAAGTVAGAAKAPKGKADVTPPKSESAPPATAPSPTPAVAAVSYDQVKSAGLALVAAKGKDAVLAVLKKFNLKSAQEAKPDQYPDLLKAIQEATK